jgi:hypothetical protein
MVRDSYTFIATPTPELQGAAGERGEVGGAAGGGDRAHQRGEGLMLVQVRGAKKLEQVRESSEHNAGGRAAAPPWRVLRAGADAGLPQAQAPCAAGARLCWRPWSWT